MNKIIILIFILFAVLSTINANPGWADCSTIGIKAPILDVNFDPDVPTAGQPVTLSFNTALQDPVPPTTTLTIQFTSGGKPLEIWALPSDEGQTQYMFNKTVLVPDQLPTSFKIRVDIFDVISNTHYACVVFTRP